MQKSCVTGGQSNCSGDCRECGCTNCGGELLIKMIRGRTKRAHRRYQRRFDRSVLRQVSSLYRWRLV